MYVLFSYDSRFHFKIYLVQPSNDALVHRLFGWAKEAPEPLQTYATGLLAAAMEVQDIAVVFRYCNIY